MSVLVFSGVRVAEVYHHGGADGAGETDQRLRTGHHVPGNVVLYRGAYSRCVALVI